MSYYEDERPRRRVTKERVRDDYYDDAVYSSRDNVRSTAVVRRRDDSVDSVEEVRRDFSPPDGRGGYYRETTIRKSGVRPARARSIGDDRYDDRFDDRSRASRDEYVATKRSRRKQEDKRDRYRRDSYSDNSSRSRTPPRRDRRKSMPEEALEALGLGGLAATLLGKKGSRSPSRNRSRSRGGRHDQSRSSDNRNRGKEQLTQALKAAVLAGAGEAFRARGEPGGWGGEKGKRVLTAAFSAGGVDGLINSGKDPEHHKTRDTIGSAIAGMATSRIVNGPRSRSRGRGFSPDSRRSRSRSRGVGDVAAGGVVAVAAKKAYDSVRSRSRGRARSRSSSYDSYDSRSPPKRSRSRSVLARGLAAVGLKDQADKVDPARRRRSSDDYYDDRYDNVGSGPGLARSRSVGPTSSAVKLPPPASAEDAPPPAGVNSHYLTEKHHFGDPNTDSESDLGSSTDEEKEHKKNRKSLLITGGLASVATIHAAHNVYQSMEKRQNRKRLLKEGKIDKEKAKQNQARDRMQDAASIGLAALGIKGAYSELKEMREKHQEWEEGKEKIRRHKVKRDARRKKQSMLEQQVYLSGTQSASMPQLVDPRAVGNHPAYYNQGQNPYTASETGVPGPVSGQVGTYRDDNPYSYFQSTQPLPPNGTGFPPPPVGYPTH